MYRDRMTAVFTRTRGEHFRGTSISGEKNFFKILSIFLLEEFQGHICVEKKYIPEKRISILFTFFLHYLIHPWKQKIIFHRSVGNRAHA